MKLKIVLSRTTANLLWCLGASAEDSVPIGSEDVIVELDEGVVTTAIDLFEEETFDEAIRRLAHAKIAEAQLAGCEFCRETFNRRGEGEFTCPYCRTTWNDAGV
jgi:tRNA(Ile2) C34 agmatinyltransferase TiaS